MQPVLFISGKLDAVLTPKMSDGMEAFIPRLERRQVEAGHWALTQAPGEVNKIVEEWLIGVVFEAKCAL